MRLRGRILTVVVRGRHLASGRTQANHKYNGLIENTLAKVTLQDQCLASDNLAPMLYLRVLNVFPLLVLGDAAGGDKRNGREKPVGGACGRERRKGRVSGDGSRRGPQVRG